jgi:hypothetical protein
MEPLNLLPNDILMHILQYWRQDVIINRGNRNLVLIEKRNALIARTGEQWLEKMIASPQLFNINTIKICNKTIKILYNWANKVYMIQKDRILNCGFVGNFINATDFNGLNLRLPIGYTNERNPATIRRICAAPKPRRRTSRRSRRARRAIIPRNQKNQNFQNIYIYLMYFILFLPSMIIFGIIKLNDFETLKNAVQNGYSSQRHHSLCWPSGCYAP